MKVEVDGNVCQKYAQCTFHAPAVFDLDDEDELHYDESPAESELDAVEQAVLGCPAQAITLHR